MIYERYKSNPTAKPVVAVEKSSGCIVAVWQSLSALARTCGETPQIIQHKIGGSWWDAAYAICYVADKSVLTKYYVIDKELTDAIFELEKCGNDFFCNDEEMFKDIIYAKPSTRTITNDDELMELIKSVEIEPVENKPVEIEPIEQADVPFISKIDTQEEAIMEPAEQTYIQSVIGRKTALKSLIQMHQDALSTLEYEMLAVDEALELERENWMKIGEAAGWL
jgi:hypothetical protein